MAWPLGLGGSTESQSWAISRCERPQDYYRLHVEREEKSRVRDDTFLAGEPG